MTISPLFVDSSMDWSIVPTTLLFGGLYHQSPRDRAVRTCSSLVNLSNVRMCYAMAGESLHSEGRVNSLLSESLIPDDSLCAALSADANIVMCRGVLRSVRPTSRKVTPSRAGARTPFFPMSYTPNGYLSNKGAS